MTEPKMSEETQDRCLTPRIGDGDYMDDRVQGGCRWLG